jgi:hypothetical protein
MIIHERTQRAQRRRNSRFDELNSLFNCENEKESTDPAAGLTTNLTNDANGSQHSLNRFAVFNPFAPLASFALMDRLVSMLLRHSRGIWDRRGKPGKKSGTSTPWKLFRRFFHSMEKVIHSVENFFHGVENAFLGAYFRRGGTRGDYCGRRRRGDPTPPNMRRFGWGRQNKDPNPVNPETSCHPVQSGSPFLPKACHLIFLQGARGAQTTVRTGVFSRGGAEKWRRSWPFQDRTK